MLEFPFQSSDFTVPQLQRTFFVQWKISIILNPSIIFSPILLGPITGVVQKSPSKIPQGPACLGKETKVNCFPRDNWGRQKTRCRTMVPCEDVLDPTSLGDQSAGKKTVCGVHYKREHDYLSMLLPRGQFNISWHFPPSWPNVTLQRAPEKSGFRIVLWINLALASLLANCIGANASFPTCA